MYEVRRYLWSILTNTAFLMVNRTRMLSQLICWPTYIPMQQYILLITYRIISFYIHTSKQFFVVMLYYLTIHTRTKIKKVRYSPPWVRNIWVGHMNGWSEVITGVIYNCVSGHWRSQLRSTSNITNATAYQKKYC